MEYQLPTYINATQNGTIPATAILPNETVYAIWIGTNDVGANSLLTDSIGVRSGVSIVEVRRCVVDVVEMLYESGARNFVILSVSQIYLFSCSESGLIQGSHAHAFTDDPTQPHTPLLANFLPQPYLDRCAEHDRMEHLHVRARPCWQCDYRFNVSNGRTTFARGTYR